MDKIDPSIREECPQCEASLTSTDRDGGYCTQCGVKLTYKVITVSKNVLRITPERRRKDR
jgi:predicted amidophosphoribosyltransferase